MNTSELFALNASNLSALNTSDLSALVALIPFAAFWAMVKGFLEASGFVNSLREAVITGNRDGVPLTLDHRELMFWDWKLTMLGILFTCAVFAFLLYQLTTVLPLIKSLERIVTSLDWAMYVAISVPLVSGGIFVLCGIKDYKGMRQALAEANRANRGQSRLVHARPDSSSVHQWRQGRSTRNQGRQRNASNFGGTRSSSVAARRR